MAAARGRSTGNLQMEIEMENLVADETNLDNLPPDIVRRLLRLNGVDGVQKLRLISRNWNKTVLGFLADRRNHPSLDMAKIDSSVAQWHTKNVNVTLDLTEKDKDHYQTFRWWPESYAGLHVDPYTMAKKIQIKSPKLMIGVDKEKTIFSLIYALLALFAAFRVHVYAAIILLVGMVAVLSWLYFTVLPSVDENRTRLHRIFGRCSHIDALVMHDLDEKTMRILRKTLTDVPITNLFIVDKKCGSYLRQQIVEMTRKHKIEAVTVCVSSCKADNLRDFFLDTTVTAGSLFIYEKTTKSETIFGQSKEFWEERVAEMNDGSFNVQVMNGEQLNSANQSNYVMRLKVENSALPLVAV